MVIRKLKKLDSEGARNVIGVCVCVTDGGGTIKFVDVVTTAVLFPGRPCSAASSSFTIKVWRLRSEDIKTWDLEFTIEDTELWNLQGYDHLLRETPLYPLLSMQEPNIIYFVLSDIDVGWQDEDNTWVVVVDMLNKTLVSSFRYTTVFSNSIESDGNMSSISLATQTGFFTCDLSKYLLTTG